MATEASPGRVDSNFVQIIIPKGRMESQGGGQFIEKNLQKSSQQVRQTVTRVEASLRGANSNLITCKIKISNSKIGPQWGVKFLQKNVRTIL